MNSASAVILPGIGTYYQGGGVNQVDIPNNVEHALLTAAGIPFRPYWRVKAELNAGTDLSDTPTLNSFYLTTTTTSVQFDELTDLYPVVTEKYNIGSNALAWSSLHVSNSAGIFFTGLTGSNGSNTEVGNFHVVDLEPQIEREWSPDNIDGLLAWFDPDSVDLSSTTTDQITSWTPKGKYLTLPNASKWIGFEYPPGNQTGNGHQPNGPKHEIISGAKATDVFGGKNTARKLVRFDGGYFEDPHYTTQTEYSLTGVEYTAMVVSVDETQTATCCPSILDVNYHGTTGGIQTALFWSGSYNPTLVFGSGYINGQRLGSFHKSSGNTAMSVTSILKDPRLRFIEVIHNVQEYGPGTTTNQHSNCAAICHQQSSTDRQMFCHMGDVIFFEKAPTTYQRRKLFEWMQKRWLNEDGASLLWESG